MIPAAPADEPPPVIADRWVDLNGPVLDVGTVRIAMTGDSTGSNVAAALALRARKGTVAYEFVADASPKVFRR